MSRNHRGSELLSFRKYRFYYQEKEELAASEDGYFWLGNRGLRIRDLLGDQVEDFGNDIRKYQDVFGNPVLRLYLSVPTFDSGDREWDSYKVLYIIEHDGHLSGLYLNGGYHLASVVLYRDMDSGESQTEELFQRAGMRPYGSSTPYTPLRYGSRSSTKSSPENASGYAEGSSTGSSPEDASGYAGGSSTNSSAEGALWHAGGSSTGSFPENASGQNKPVLKRHSMPGYLGLILVPVISMFLMTGVVAGLEWCRVQLLDGHSTFLWAMEGLVFLLWFVLMFVGMPLYYTQKDRAIRAAVGRWWRGGGGGRKKLPVLLAAAVLLTAVLVFTGIREYRKGHICGEGLTWKIDAEGNLVITGNGRMDDYNFLYDDAPWDDVKNRIRSVTVEEGVAYVGEEAFSHYDELERIYIAGSVREIGEGAFGHCAKLSEIVFGGAPPDSIGHDAFEQIQAVIRYPEGDPSWTEEAVGKAFQNVYNPNLTFAEQ